MDREGVSFSVDVTAYDRGTYWAGMVEQVGTYVYADTFDGLRSQADDVLRLLVSSFASREEMVNYFTRRGVGHRIVSPDEGRHPPRRISIQQEALVPA